MKTWVWRAAIRGGELAERQAGRAIRSSIRHHKLKPYRAAEKAERQALAANAEYFYQKSLRDNPEIAQAATNPISRLWQKQQIKRQYAKAARTAGQTAGAAAQGAAKTAASSTKAAKAAAAEGTPKRRGRKPKEAAQAAPADKPKRTRAKKAE